ncbi:hypothetical protein JTE90_006414 [Oedothorax gibbosus]|uniref:Uncharacterized protein n=1 Tax=Oedothorax gibbosus TaxID=931172 RepID=A0AAV6VYP2_9ARAC|nr:hypothetical protein JTE90_006414 [Oedothorax gibbosus]
MEITEDFPQKNCKYKPKVNGRKPKQILEEHRKKRENKDSVGGRNHLKTNGILGLNDERVLVPDDSKDLITNKFFDVIENKNKIEVDEPCCALDTIGSQAGKSGDNFKLFMEQLVSLRKEEKRLESSEFRFVRAKPNCKNKEELEPTVLLNGPTRENNKNVDITEVAPSESILPNVDTIEESVYCPASSNKEDDSPIDSGVFSSYSPEAPQVLEINTDEGIDLFLSDAFDISKENTRPKSIQENKAEIEVEESVALLSDVTKCPEQFSFEENNKNVDITKVAPSESTQQPEALLKDKAETSEDQLPGSENNKNVDITEVAPSERIQQPEALPKEKAETSEDQLPGSELQKELAMIIWPISKNKTQITSRKKYEAKEIHKKGSDYIVPENHEVVPELSTSISQSLKENNKNENIKKPPLVESLCESFKQSEELSSVGAETSEKLQDYCELFEPAPTSQSPLKDLTEGSDDRPFLIHLSEELLESKRKAEAVGRQSKPKRRKGNHTSATLANKPKRRKGNHTSAKPVNKNNENENIKKPPPVECLFESINQSSVGAETSEKLQDYCVITEKNLLQGKSKAELEELFAPAPTSQSPLKDLTEGSDAQPFLIHLTEENEKSKKVLEPSVTSQISHSKEEKSHDLYESKRKAEAVEGQSKHKRPKGNNTSAKPVNSDNKNVGVCWPLSSHKELNKRNLSSIESHDAVQNYSLKIERTVFVLYKSKEVDGEQLPSTKKDLIKKADYSAFCEQGESLQNYPPWDNNLKSDNFKLFMEQLVSLRKEEKSLESSEYKHTYSSVPSVNWFKCTHSSKCLPVELSEIHIENEKKCKSYSNEHMDVNKEKELNKMPDFGMQNSNEHMDVNKEKCKDKMPDFGRNTFLWTGSQKESEVSSQASTSSALSSALNTWRKPLQADKTTPVRKICSNEQLTSNKPTNKLVHERLKNQDLCSNAIELYHTLMSSKNTNHRLKKVTVVEEVKQNTHPHLSSQNLLSFRKKVVNTPPVKVVGTPPVKVVGTPPVKFVETPPVKVVETPPSTSNKPQIKNFRVNNIPSPLPKLKKKVTSHSPDDDHPKIDSEPSTEYCDGKSQPLNNPSASLNSHEKSFTIEKVPRKEPALLETKKLDKRQLEITTIEAS